jgi:hypothetical protein
MFALTPLVAVAVDDEAGFGGSTPEAADVVTDDVSPSRPETTTAPTNAPATPSTTTPTTAPTTPSTTTPSTTAPTAPSTPPSTAALPTWTSDGGGTHDGPTSKLAALLAELARAHLDPARSPLLQLRLEVARLDDELAAAEARGLTSARAVEEQHAAARMLLADVERIAMHRMTRCAERSGQPAVAVRNYRMTAAGAVQLSTSELLAQANALDPPGCARIDLVDAAVVDRVRRARALKVELRTRDFPFHRLGERRAREDELKTLLKQLADDGLPGVLAPGERGWGR